jgi:hypothetical protein
VLEGLAVDEDRHRDEGDHEDLERPGQYCVGRAHDEGVAVEQHAQDDGHRYLFHQDAHEHLEPADGHDAPEPGMGADDEEERPADKEQQEPELEHDESERDEQDE